MFRNRVALLIVLLSCLVYAPGALAQPSQAKVEAALNLEGLTPGSPAVLAVVLDINKGFHAQSAQPLDKNAIPTRVQVAMPAGLSAGEPIFPPGQIKEYPVVGKVSLYSGRVIVYVPIDVSPTATAGEAVISGQISYQICDEEGSCFPEEITPFVVKTRILPAGQSAAPARAELFKDYRPGSRSAPATQPAAVTAPPTGGGSGWSVHVAFTVAFLAGVVFNIVPCVLPVLPIKIIGFYEAAHHNRTRTVALSALFGLGIVTVFAVLAMLILVWKGLTWGQQFSHPAFAWGIVVLMVVIAAWLFGLFNFDLPAGVYSFSPNHTTYWGNFLWGILTAVMSTPCTGPYFPAVMIWAQSQPAWLGVSIMIMVGVGMAFPYVILSLFPQVARSIPSGGPWSELFKQMAGFIMLGFAAYFAAGRFTTSGAWWATVPVALLAGFYLMARTAQLSKAPIAAGISAAVSVVPVTVMALIAAQFSGLLQKNSGATNGVQWVEYSDQVLDTARKSNQVVLVKFTASWCLNCQTIEGTVFKDERTFAALRKHNVVTVKADLTSNKAAGWPRLRQLNPTGGIPLTAIYFPGKEQPEVIASIYTTDTLIAALEKK